MRSVWWVFQMKISLNLQIIRIMRYIHILDSPHGGLTTWNLMSRSSTWRITWRCGNFPYRITIQYISGKHSFRQERAINFFGGYKSFRCDRGLCKSYSTMVIWLIEKLVPNLLWYSYWMARKLRFCYFAQNGQILYGDSYRLKSLFLVFSENLIS